MTHDELLAKIDKWEYSDYQAIGTTPEWPYKALRAVVELHKPQPTTIPSDPKCDACSGLDWADYPCPTIQAIEKELK